MLQTYFAILALRGAAVTLALLQMTLVSAWVPPDEYGRYSVVLSVALAVMGTALSWTNEATLRYGREEFLAKMRFGGILAARLIVHLAASAAVLPLAAWGGIWLARSIGVPWEPLVALLCALLFLAPLAEVANVAAQIVSRPIAWGWIPLLQQAVQLAVLFAAFTVGATDWARLLLGAVLGYLAVIVAIGAAIPGSALRPVRSSLRDVGRLLRFSWPIPLVRLSVFAMIYMDLWMLHLRGDLEAVGVYAWAYNLTLLVAAVLAPLSGMLTSRAIDSRVAGREEALIDQLRFGRAVLLFAASLAPALIGVARLLLDAVPLGDYGDARLPLLVLAVAAVYQLGMALVEPLIFSRRGLVAPAALIFGSMACTKAAIAYVLIPSLGLGGTAVATLAAFALGMAAEWGLLSRAYREESGFRCGLLLLWASVPAIALVAMLSLGRGAGVAVGVAVCSAMVLAGRRAGWFADLQLLRPQLWPGLQPVLGWLSSAGRVQGLR